MKETDIRDRIAQFLKKTARTVVVPASMGLGLSSTGCDEHSLHNRAVDAGPDSGVATEDGPGPAPDRAPDLSDAAIRNDLPEMMLPYLLALPRDAAPEVASEAGGAPGYDADRDVATDAASATLDLRAELAYPEPPYLAPPFALDEAPGGEQASPAPGPARDKK